MAFNTALPCRVDALEFAQLVDGATGHQHRRANTCAFCARQLQEAVALYHHPLLHDFALDDCAEFELWTLAEREQLHQRALTAMAQLAAYSFRKGDHASAQRYARRQLDLDPFNETVHRQLMQVLAQTGQRTAALAQYQSCVRLLAAEFGAEPEPATHALYEDIKHGQTGAGFNPVQRNLPTPPTACLGRARALADIQAYIELPHARLLTLVGPGGVGKTRLAIEAASQLTRHFDDGVAFVALAPLRTATLVLSAIAQVVEVEVNGRQSLDERLKYALHLKELLLVLDNLEHVLQVTPLLADLLAHCPRLTILATSREPLHLTGEQLYPVPPLATPSLAEVQHLSVAQVEQSDAVQLFVQRARGRVPTFAPDAEAVRAIAAICRRVDGLPLAIELAASQVGWQTPDALLAHLSGVISSLRLLIGGARDLPLRQQTMRATIAWSVDLLDPAAQTVFRRLGIFLGGFTAAAAALVCAPLQPEATNVLQTRAIQSILASLAEKHLLQPTTATDEPRYTLLETIRDYALERLDDTSETYQCAHQHARCFLALVEQAEPELSGAEQQYWLDRLETEHNNIQAALRWALEADEIEVALRIASPMWRFWDTRGYHSEGRRWLESALAHGAANEAVRAKALNALGMLTYSQSDFAVAWVHLEEGLTLRRTLNDLPSIAIALNNLGMTAWAQGDYKTAQQLYEECLVVDRATGDQAGSAYTLGNLGLVFHHQGRHEQGRKRFAESLDLFRFFGDRRQEAFALHNLGMVAYHQHDLGAAHTLYTASLTIKEELQDKGSIASTLVYLAQVTVARGELAATRDLLLRSIALQRELGDTMGLTDTLYGCAAYAAAHQMLEATTILFGATRAIREACRFFQHAMDRAAYEPSLVIARHHMDPTAFQTAWARGQTLTFDQTLAYALNVLESGY